MDVSPALDLVRATYDRQFEVAIIVSQDWDFGPDVVRPVHDRRGSKRFDSIHWHPDAVPWRCLFHPSCTSVGLGNVSGHRHEGMGTGRLRALEFLPSLTPRGGLMLNDDRLDDRLRWTRKTGQVAKWESCSQPELAASIRATLRRSRVLYGPHRQVSTCLGT